jgi:hypothetical protein
MDGMSTMLEDSVTSYPVFSWRFSVADALRVTLDESTYVKLVWMGLDAGRLCPYEAPALSEGMIPDHAERAEPLARWAAARAATTSTFCLSAV